MVLKAKKNSLIGAHVSGWLWTLGIYNFFSIKLCPWNFGNFFYKTKEFYDYNYDLTISWY